MIFSRMLLRYVRPAARAVRLSVCNVRSFLLSGLIIIIIITDLYSAFRSEDTEALKLLVDISAASSSLGTWQYVLKF